MEGKRARPAHGTWLSTASHSNGHSSSPRLKHTHKIETSLSSLTCVAGAFIPPTFTGRTLPSIHRHQLLSMPEPTHACKDFPDHHSSSCFSLLSSDPVSQLYTLRITPSQGPLHKRLLASHLFLVFITIFLVPMRGPGEIAFLHHGLSDKFL